MTRESRRWHVLRVETDRKAFPPREKRSVPRSVNFVRLGYLLWDTNAICCGIQTRNPKICVTFAGDVVFKKCPCGEITRFPPDFSSLKLSKLARIYCKSTRTHPHHCFVARTPGRKGHNPETGKHAQDFVLLCRARMATHNNGKNQSSAAINRFLLSSCGQEISHRPHMFMQN